MRIHIRTGFFWGAGTVFKARGWKKEWGMWGIGISDHKIKVALKLKEKIYVRVGKYPDLYRITPTKARKYGFANVQNRTALLVIPATKFDKVCHSFRE